ncbi:MAG: hypothetical protein V4592_01920 [Bacteroidota bacterium]
MPQEQYLQVSFLTITGVKRIIDLGDFVYGEWIVYEDNVPKYIVDLNTEHESDIIINRQFNRNKKTIQGVISKINEVQGINLSLMMPPLIRIVLKEEYINLNLRPLPADWLKAIY